MTHDDRATPTQTDEIISLLCKAINEGMDKFEASGDRYANLIEKHCDAVNNAILERGVEIQQDLDRQGLNKLRRPR